jgi:hypothetical protein
MLPDGPPVPAGPAALAPEDEGLRALLAAHAAQSAALLGRPLSSLLAEPQAADEAR